MRHPFAPLVAVSLLIAACAPQGPSTETAPTAPTNVLATPGPGYMTITWQDESDDETGFVIYRDTAPGTSVTATALEPIGETPADAETFIDRTIEPGIAYTYAVAAAGAGGTSASTAASGSATVEPGIDMSVGTYNIAPVLAEAQTAYAFYFFLPVADLPTDPVTMSIDGPAGWNGDATYAFDIPASRFEDGWGWAATFTPAVAGAYTATATIGGTTYSATASTTASNLLDVAQNVSVTGHSSDAAAFAWDAVAGAESYSVTVYDAPLRFGPTVFGSAFSTATSLVVDGLSLPAGEYYAGVFSFPIDRTVERPLKPEEFHVSLAVSDTFAVGAAGCADPDPVADANLASAIRDDLGLAASPTCADLLTLTYFTASDRGITDLTGLEYALHIYDAELSGNGITDLTPLAPLVLMEKLHLNGNGVGDLSPLVDLELLDTLTLRANAIEDLSPLLANDGLGDGDVVDLRDNPLDLTGGSDAMADITALETRGVSVLHDGLVEIDGTWATTLTATASTCGEVPVGTVVAGDVAFETYLDQVTATSDTGAVSTGTRFRNTVTLTRSDVAPGGEAYEVASVSEWQDASFAGESVYTFEGGCAITWAFAGTRIEE